MMLAGAMFFVAGAASLAGDNPGGGAFFGLGAAFIAIGVANKRKLDKNGDVDAG